MSLDLANDRVGALVEDVAALGDHTGVAPLQPLGRELDGVSGFLISWAMRRATSAQAEVRWAVDEFGDVVERHDKAVVLGRDGRSAW